MMLVRQLRGLVDLAPVVSVVVVGQPGVLRSQVPELHVRQIVHRDSNPGSLLQEKRPDPSVLMAVVADPTVDGVVRVVGPQDPHCVPA